METHHYAQMGFPINGQGSVIPKEEDHRDFTSFPAAPFDRSFSTWEHDLLPELGYFPPVSCLNMFLTEPLFTDYASVDFAFSSGGFNECSGHENQPELEQNRNPSRIGGVDLTAARRELKPPKIPGAGEIGIIDSRKLSFKTISEHFYTPITQAAKELNVGLTQLKKRCREVGIRRWPHRKLMSLQTLIDNQERGEGEVGKKRSRSIAILEREKKLLEEIPDMELGEQTKRMRQACFKAKHKKRKMDNNVVLECGSKSNIDKSSEVCGSSRDVIEVRDGFDYDRADEGFDLFFGDYFPSDYMYLL